MASHRSQETFDSGWPEPVDKAPAAALGFETASADPGSLGHTPTGAGPERMLQQRFGCGTGHARRFETRHLPVPACVAVALLASAAATTPVFADVEPAKGTLLVATDRVGGPNFAESVILLLHHDDTGTMGLIVNKKTEATPGQALPGLDLLRGYSGRLYYGGPVDRFAIRALLRSGEPPADAVRIVDDVYLTPLDEASLGGDRDEATLRFFVGYAGWSPGQLDAELARGSWHVVPASADAVFTEKPRELWRELSPPEILRVFVEHAPPRQAGP